MQQKSFICFAIYGVYAELQRVFSIWDMHFAGLRGRALASKGYQRLLQQIAERYIRLLPAWNVICAG
jgi:hypothetical protein